MKNKINVNIFCKIFTGQISSQRFDNFRTKTKNNYPVKRSVLTAILKPVLNLSCCLLISCEITSLLLYFILSLTYELALFQTVSIII